MKLSWKCTSKSCIIKEDEPILPFLNSMAHHRQCVGERTKYAQQTICSDQVPRPPSRPMTPLAPIFIAPPLVTPPFTEPTSLIENDDASGSVVHRPNRRSLCNFPGYTRVAVDASRHASSRLVWIGTFTPREARGRDANARAEFTPDAKAENTTAEAMEQNWKSSIQSLVRLRRVTVGAD
jgi:hypothetical protein